MSEGKDGLRVQVVGANDFGHMILENLRKAGVQNTRKGERLKFDTLDPYAGEWIHGQATYTEYGPQMTQMDADNAKGSGNSSVSSASSVDSKGSSSAPSASSVDKPSVVKRAAICIGPEHGTVGSALVKEAAKEAVKGVGFDLLIVCGFAFDPSVSEEVKRYGKLTVLPTKMNPDLAMGDELLKKTGAGNLFMVFGEPDVEIRPYRPQMTQMNTDKTKGKQATTSTKEGLSSVPSASSVDKHSVDQLEVEIHGLDVYDPTTGAIRNSSTDDIACWFIDTDYNGESFFVRHAYFTGADEPYEKLKRALRADIDEATWSTLYSTVSRPFPKPTSGKIAVKVINHYGDEVLKVFGV